MSNTSLRKKSSASAVSVNDHRENKFLSIWLNPLPVVVIMAGICREQRIKYCDIRDTQGLQGEEFGADGWFSSNLF